MISAREFNALLREVATLKLGLAMRPLRGGGSPVAPLMKLSISGGNTLASGQAGIKFATVTDVPSAYDPNVTSSFVDGIGRGVLRIDGVAQTGFVLIVNDGTAGMNYALLTSDTPVAVSTKSIPVAGDPDGATVTAYVPWFN